MRLAPGPIPPLADNSAPLAPSQPVFANMVATDLAEMPGAISEIGALLDAIAAFDPGPDIQLFSDALDLAGQGMIDAAVADPELDISTTESAFSASANEMVIANQNLPAEAFQPVPDLWLVGGVPQLLGPPTDANIGLSSTLQTGPSAYAAGSAWTLSVEVGVGGTPFYPASNSVIVAYIQVDAVSRPTLAMGTTNLAGAVVATGVFTPSDVGAWHVTVTADGQAMNGHLDFTVVPANTPVVLPAIATLDNITNPSSSNFVVGDFWALKVMGDPNQPVVLDSQQNGVALPPFAMGNTDAGGSLLSTGQMTAATIGNWIEIYRVGANRVSAPLAFSVGP